MLILEEKGLKLMILDSSYKELEKDEKIEGKISRNNEDQSGNG